MKLCNLGARAAARAGVVLTVIALWATAALAQFSGNVQGAVADPSGAAIPNAAVKLVNLGTRVTANTKTDAAGNYSFVNLQPGSYEISAEASGFTTTVVTVNLLTDQTLNVPITLALQTVTQKLEVTAEAPVLNTAETRNQMTLATGTLSELPMAGRNMISLVTMAPGVSGVGTMGGGVPGSGGTPGSGVDNYSTETQVDVSANGQGTMSNLFIVDGLDVTSGIRQGVLNLTPNPDSVQETSIQVNTFAVDYGAASSIQMAMTTKSGGDQFHGVASDYFNYQGMFAGTEFIHQYNPFHGNNISAAVGGPIIPHKQFFFFFSVEPLRSSAAAPAVDTYIDPAFTSWAQANYPNNIGPGIMAKYLPTNLVPTGTVITAAQANLAECVNGPSTATQYSCSAPLEDTGILASTNFRNGTQWFVRVDKYFAKDRVYGSFTRTTLATGGGVAIPQFATKSDNWERAEQFNWTHTFSPTTLNEAIFAGNRVEGYDNQTGDFSVPPISVSGLSAMGQGGQTFGVGFAKGDFIQHNYHWRDVLTHIRGTHTMKFGYTGWYGDDVEPFQGPRSQPAFFFTDLEKFAQDAPLTETGVMYDPTSGQPVLWEWNAASKTWGLFTEDTWKLKHNVTLNYGLRWDDYGNPYQRSATTVFGNFYLGPGATFGDQVANGFAKATHHALNHSVTDLLSPRFGIAWDPTGKGDWVVRGGFGIFHNWLTQANVQEEFRGSPPGPIIPTFFAAGTGTHPLFVLGNGSSTPPFGFTYPSLPANGLDAAGGELGAQIQIGAIDPNLISPVAYIVAGTLEHKIGSRYVASVGYSGAKSYNLLANGNAAGLVQYGVDINAMPDDLIIHNSLIPTRYNPSFGEIIYSYSNRVANYDGVFFDFKGRFNRGFLDASYTRSRSMDDAGTYPDALVQWNNPHNYYGPSPWDVPNRFSLTFDYTLTGMNRGRGAIGQLTGGWGIGGTSILQSGYPFTVVTRGPFKPLCQVQDATCGVSPTNTFIGYAPGSGDYNADGDYGQESGIGAPASEDYPDANSYTESTSRKDFLNGTVFTPGQFSPPATFGNEGNEKPQQFRLYNFAETDAAVYKNTRFTEKVNLELRFEFYNLFNRANVTNFDMNTLDATFGRSLGQQLPRWWQVGAKITF